MRLEIFKIIFELKFLNKQNFLIETSTKNKITRYRVHLSKEIVSSYFVGNDGVNIQQQLNSVSSILIFENTSVDPF